MTDTPLSEIMAELDDAWTPEGYERFLTLFRDSVVGIIATGPASQDGEGRTIAGPNLTARCTTRDDRRRRVLAYADPEASLRNFGPRFNAGISGRVVLQMAATDADCAGVLVNSAISEIFLIIDRSTAQVVTADQP